MREDESRVVKGKRIVGFRSQTASEKHQEMRSAQSHTTSLTASLTLFSRKFIFTPGPLLKEMIQKVSIQKLQSSDGSVTPTPEGPDKGGGGGGGGEAPDPTA